jgi:hypothetical protein
MGETSQEWSTVSALHGIKVVGVGGIEAGSDPMTTVPMNRWAARWCPGHAGVDACKWAAKVVDRWAPQLFEFSKDYPNWFKCMKSKIENVTFPAFKNCGKFITDRFDEGDNFLHWSNFQFEVDFEIQNHQVSMIWKCFEF